MIGKIEHVHVEFWFPLQETFLTSPFLWSGFWCVGGPTILKPREFGKKPGYRTGGGARLPLSGFAFSIRDQLGNDHRCGEMIEDFMQRFERNIVGVY